MDDRCTVLGQHLWLDLHRGGSSPWVVYGLLKTSRAVTLIAPGYVATSLIGFTAIYTFLAIIEIGLMIRVAKVPPAIETPAEAERVPELIY